MKRFYSEQKNALDEIVERREQAASRNHDQALDHFRYVYPDLMNVPAERFVYEREQVKGAALNKGETVDWDRAYREIGDKLRGERTKNG